MNTIFQKNRSQWSREQLEQVKYFYQCNQFFSRLWDDEKDLETIISITYYAQVSATAPLLLSDIKKPAAIVVLSGNIRVFKKVLSKKLPSDPNGYQKYFQKLGSNRGLNTDSQSFVKVGEYIGFNSTVLISSECKIESMHGEDSECLYVPSFLYTRFMKQKLEEIEKLSYSILSKVFPDGQRKALVQLAQSGCKVRRIKFQEYVYHEGDTPKNVYVATEGSFKICKQGVSSFFKDIVVLGPQALMGHQDIESHERQQSVICCSSTAKLLEIPRKYKLSDHRAFIQFVKQNLLKLELTHPKIDNSLIKPTKKRSKSGFDVQINLPTIFRFYQGMKSKNQSQKQYKLIKNTHILLDSSREKHKRIRSRSSVENYPVDFMEKRVKLYHRMRPNPSQLNITHRLL